MPNINFKAWLITLVAVAIVLALFWAGVFSDEGANEARAFLRELRRIL
ncbi:hypothetical protein GWD52_10575 [Enterobacteriaceae bacterium 4M9]|nr:hypothetical protein [Enterobacteriaceae bacterium 4M9]